MIALWMVYATVVGCLLAAAAYALEHLAAAHGWARRWAWLGAMLALPLVPLFTSELPPLLSTAEPSAAISQAISATASGQLAVIPAHAAVKSASHDASLLEQSLATATGAWAAFDVASLWASAISRAQRQLAQLARFDRWFVSGWLVTTLFLLAGYVMAAVKLAAQRRRWLAARIDGTPVLIASDVGPAVVGTIRPAIVLPLWSLSIDAPLRALILAHEREHLRARDPLALHLMALSAYLLPWNLPVWWMLRRLRLAIEVDCDQRVLCAGGDAHQYADLLLTVGSRRSTGTRLLAPALVEGKSFLSRRIIAMCRGRSRFRYLRLIFSGSVAYFLLAVAYTIPRPALAQKAHRTDSEQQQTWAMSDTVIPSIFEAAPAGTDVSAETPLFVEGEPVRAKRRTSQRNTPEKIEHPLKGFRAEFKFSGVVIPHDSVAIELPATAAPQRAILDLLLADHDSLLSKLVMLRAPRPSAMHVTFTSPDIGIGMMLLADSPIKAQVRKTTPNTTSSKQAQARLYIAVNNQGTQITATTVQGIVFGDSDVVVVDSSKAHALSKIMMTQSFSVALGNTSRWTAEISPESDTSAVAVTAASQ